MPQDLATGVDGRIKGAKPITLDNGEARVRGIVTYPGGDRTDWKKLELPKDSAGTLSLKLSWTTPRPGLVLGVDVFDEYGRQVVSEKARKKKARLTFRGSRTAAVANAKGTYLIRVYAPFRGDAGAYTLKLSYSTETTGPVDPDLPIPDPPRLPAVPIPAAPCTNENYKTNPECKRWCPDPVDTSWKGCAGKCNLAAPDINIASCRKVMPCPEPPDSRVRDCKGKVPVCAEGAPPSTTCLPPPPAKPVKATIVLVSQKGSRVEIKMDRGQDYKVDKGWSGKLLDSRGRAVPESDFVVTKVSKRESWGMVDLTTDQVNAARKVLLSPP